MTTIKEYIMRRLHTSRILPKNNESAFCRLRLICIVVAGLGALLSRFLEGAPYKFMNE